MGFRGTAVFKQGGKGCVVATGGELVRRPGCTVEAYDTVGSGDIFGASYCYGAMSGWDSRRCADYAAVFTALSIGEYHNVKNLPRQRSSGSCAFNYRLGDRAFMKELKICVIGAGSTYS